MDPSRQQQDHQQNTPWPPPTSSLRPLKPPPSPETYQSPFPPAPGARPAVGQSINPIAPAPTPPGMRPVQPGPTPPGMRPVQPGPTPPGMRPVQPGPTPPGMRPVQPGPTPPGMRPVQPGPTPPGMQPVQPGPTPPGMQPLQAMPAPPGMQPMQAMPAPPGLSPMQLGPAPPGMRPMQQGLAPAGMRPMQPGPSLPGMRPSEHMVSGPIPGHAQALYSPQGNLPFAPAQSASQMMPGSYSNMPFPQAPSTFNSMGTTQNEVLDEFKSLTLAPSAPGAHDNIVDGSSLPRPENGKISGPSSPPGSCPENAHHSFIRMTTNHAPRSASLLERFQLPYGAIVQPLAEHPDGPEVPVVKLGSAGIQRCRRCRTYINPFVHWTDDGRRWECNVCKALNNTPHDYYCTLDEYGRRRDAPNRPELSVGSVEYVAPPEYMVRAPMPSVYLFVVDVSSAETSSTIIKSIADGIRSSLDRLQGDDRKRVGFLTFDRTLHFYNLKASDTAKMFVVPEIEDPFLPQPDDLLINVEEARDKIENFLETWPSNFRSNPTQQSAMGAALQAAFMILSSTGGKLELFLTTPPSLGAGSIVNRENPAFYNTDREINLRNPVDAFYKKFSAECSRVHICVDLYSFCPNYTDLASITTLSKYTGGQVYRFPGFHPLRDAGRLGHEIVHNLTRYTAWEGVMRLRSSKGLKISSFLGHFFVRSTDLLALPSTDPDKGFAIEIKHDETILDGQVACIQCALLYTASSGERRIRVHTLQVPITHEISDLYKGADAAALTAFLAKAGVDYSYRYKLSDTQKMIEGRLIASLREYRVMHSRHFRGTNKLIYPDSLKFFPLWILALLKSNAIRSEATEVSADDRICSGYDLLSFTVEKIIHHLYPTLYMIKDFASQSNGAKDIDSFGCVMPCSAQCLQATAVYLLDTVKLIFLLIGSSVPLEYMAQLTGIPPGTLKSSPLHLLKVEPPQKNEASQRLCHFISEIRKERRGFQPLVLIQIGSEQERHLKAFFVEDRENTTRNYLDFICMIHRQIGPK